MARIPTHPPWQELFQRAKEQWASAEFARDPEAAEALLRDAISKLDLALKRVSSFTHVVGCVGTCLTRGLCLGMQGDGLSGQPPQLDDKERASCLCIKGQCHCMLDEGPVAEATLMLAIKLDPQLR